MMKKIEIIIFILVILCICTYQYSQYIYCTTNNESVGAPKCSDYNQSNLYKKTMNDYYKECQVDLGIDHPECDYYNRGNR
jgi:hypothetical protein